MSRLDPKKAAAFAALDQVIGKKSAEALTDLFIEIGSVPGVPEDFRRYQVAASEKLIKEHRTAKARSGQTQLELVNLFEVDEEGNKQHYYRRCGEMNASEAAQHLAYWNGKVEQDKAQLARYTKYHVKRHGKKLQRLLDFALPVEEPATA